MKEKYIEDLRDIREMMQRSSHLVSLSGLSGISAGVFALLGAYAAYQTVYPSYLPMDYQTDSVSHADRWILIAIALATLFLALTSGIFFTSREARKKQEKLWDHQTKKLVYSLLLPLVAGGVVCLMLLFKGYIVLIAPLTLVFYGLSLLNASKYTLSEIRNLGYCEIILGWVAVAYTGYGLLFWSIGFGVLHIVYGVYMELKYSR